MPRPGAMRMGRSRRNWPGRAVGSGTVGDRRGRAAAVLRRDPGAGIRAGAGTVLGRRGRDLHDGVRHRDHGGGDRDDSRRRQGIRRAVSKRRRGYGSCHARHRGRGGVLVLAFGALLLLGYMCERETVCSQTLARKSSGRSARSACRAACGRRRGPRRRDSVRACRAVATPFSATRRSSARASGGNRSRRCRDRRRPARA